MQLIAIIAAWHGVTEVFGYEKFVERLQNFRSNDRLSLRTHVTQPELDILNEMPIFHAVQHRAAFIVFPFPLLICIIANDANTVFVELVLEDVADIEGNRTDIGIYIHLRFMLDGFNFVLDTVVTK